MATPLKTFICYAHEDRQVVDDLREHLSIYEKNKLLEIWYDGKILAGEKWDDSIQNALMAADIILMFISVKFINSEYVEKNELEKALSRHRAGEANLIPIIVSSCDWEEYFEIGQFQALPNQAKPILSRHFPHKDDAYHEVAIGIKQVAQSISQKKRTLQEKADAEKLRLEQERSLEAEKNEKSRHRRDEAAWKKILAEVEKTEDSDHKILLFKAYCDDAEYHNHRGEAEDELEKIGAVLKLTQTLEAAKKAALQQQEDAAKAAEALRQRKAAEQKQKEADATKAAEALRQREATEKKRLAEEAARQKDLPDMVLIKGRTFQMGEKEIATPVHTVTLSDFEIGKYPVTQKLWQAIMGNNPSLFKGNDLPVENVSWDDCQEFLKKLHHKTGKNYRLPTEAEWEFAARGGMLSKGFQYAGSNDLKAVGWFWENSGDKALSGEWKPDLISKNNCRTHPVGLKQANELGLFDMSGNVWEWCTDWHGDYPSESQTNPKSVENGSHRVVRGGSWYFHAQFCRVAYRTSNSPGIQFNYIGFRLASSPQ